MYPTGRPGTTEIVRNLGSSEEEDAWAGKSVAPRDRPGGPQLWGRVGACGRPGPAANARPGPGPTHGRGGSGNLRGSGRAVELPQPLGRFRGEFDAQVPHLAGVDLRRGAGHQVAGP